MELSIPSTLEDENGQKVKLSGGKFTFFASYQNMNIGYVIHDPMPTSGEAIQDSLLIADMNMWVGVVESNHVEVEFP
jgi:hypothetical protein